MLERYVGEVKNRLVVGSDIRVAQGAIVPPSGYQYLKLNITYENFPLLRPNGACGLELSLPSKVAQLGGNTKDLTGAIIKSNELKVDNLSERPFVLEEDDPVGRFYLIDGREIRGDALREGLEGEINIDGNYRLIFDEYEEPIGVRFPIDPKSRKKIQPERSFIRIKNLTGNYRGRIDEMSMSIRESREPVHWNADTFAKLTLGANVYSRMRGAFVVRRKQRSICEEFPYRMLRSTFIDPGTNWNLRGEFFGPISREDADFEIEVVFMKL